MPAHSTDISVRARYAELPALLAALARRAAALGLSEAAGQRLQVVLEELFTNTIVHGHRQESAELVQVRLSRHEAGVHLRYCDNAPPFDLGRRQEGTADNSLGGFGLPLIKGMSKRIHYTRREPLNIVELDF